MKRFALLLLACSLVSCAVNPVTGDRQLALVSEGQEIQIGREVASNASQEFGLVRDEALQAYVQSLGSRLAQASERPDLPWSFQVVDEATPNAFAAPGGFIFVTRGLLALLRNEAELVSILGHEIGHVTARHSVAMMSRAQLAQLGIGIASVLSPTAAQFGELAAGGLQLLFLKYGRDAERQADDLGYRYALEQGYDVREMVNVFAALQQSAQLAGQNPVPSWQASHPYPAERIQRINKQLASLPPASMDRRVGEADYLQRIDGLAYGENPRKGYFDDHRFVHPELAFRIDFPKGWRTQNLSNAVVAGSPKDDALIQLMLAKGSAKEAASTFFSQQGMTAGRTATGTIGGLPAITGDFEVQTEQTRLGGVVTFIELDGRTYRILGYTPAQQRASYDNTFRTALNSFARLTNPQALNRQPLQISVVRLPRSMTLQQFSNSHPSMIPLPELGLINQLQGPGDVMPAGFNAKRVIDIGN